jgi:hypothetical protein
VTLRGIVVPVAGWLRSRRVTIGVSLLALALGLTEGRSGGA